jgi:hypothetical protein
VLGFENYVTALADITIPTFASRIWINQKEVSVSWPNTVPGWRARIKITNLVLHAKAGIAQYLKIRQDHVLRAERADPQVTFLACNRKVLRSNVGRGTGYPDQRFYGFAQSLQTNVDIVSISGHGRFLANPFQFITFHRPTIRR